MLENPMDVNYLEISRGKLRRNANAITEWVKVPVIGVLKCDGYGVTIGEAAQAWKEAGVTMYAVSEPAEAIRLRDEGFREDILLLAPCADPMMIGVLLDRGIILTVSDEENAALYVKTACGRPVRVHVAVDTGMGRFGVRWTDVEQLAEIYAMQGLQIEGIFSHFSASFEAEYHLTALQLERFTKVTEALAARGIKLGMRHIANTCAALRFRETWLDAVRIGSGLVGVLPCECEVPLESVAVLKAQVVARKRLEAGDATGYASVYRTPQTVDAVVVAIGHEVGFGLSDIPDNFSRRDLLRNVYHAVRDFKDNLYVTYEGRRLPLLGRAGTQYSLFDASGTDIRPGDYVTSTAKYMFPTTRRKLVD